ncbi:MAG: hypothetical protein RX316_03715 [bacterium]|nr:hypothetical protein [bacterium]
MVSKIRFSSAGQSSVASCHWESLSLTKVSQKSLVVCASQTGAAAPHPDPPEARLRRVPTPAGL